jgi:LUD domain
LYLTNNQQGAGSVTITLPDPGPPNLEFEHPADRARLERTAAALASRGIQAQVADSGKEARRLALEAIPPGAEVHVALSETMRELGITAELEQSGRYDPVRPRLNALDRESQAREIRKLGAAPDYLLGSAHAVTDGGEIIVGSGSGSQLGGYAFAAGRVILIVGHQKLVRDLDEGLRRVREYSLPREHARMQSLGRPGSLLAKTLIIHRERPGRTDVILVPETIGFLSPGWPAVAPPEPPQLSQLTHDG